MSSSIVGAPAGDGMADDSRRLLIDDDAQEVDRAACLHLQALLE